MPPKPGVYLRAITTTDRLAEGSGTYEVNADCTGATSFQPAPGVTIEERFVIVNQGQELVSRVSNPPPVMITTIQKKIGRP